MARSVTSLFSILLLAGAARAAVLQHPLQPSDFGLSFSDDAALDKLRASVGDRLEEKVTPIGISCYNSSLPREPQCDYTTRLRTNDSWITDQIGGYFYGNLAACQATGETCVLPVTDTSIPQGAVCHQGSVPSMVIDIQSLDTLESDIKAAFEYTRKTNTPLVTKNTGHDWKGRSSGPGSLALWTHKLKHPIVPIVLQNHFTPVNCSSHAPEIVFHYGPGQQWGDAYEFAEQNSLTVVGGTCGTVGIAGWLQGGGHSPMTPLHGMGVDNVRQLEIVTPSKGKVIANECQNQDLFFAMRGGGGAAFGIITNITYKAIERKQVQDFRYSINLKKTEEVEKLLQILTSNVTFLSQKGWGGYMKMSASMQSVELSNSNITPEEAAKHMEPLIEFLVEKNATYQNLKYNLTSHNSWSKYIEAVMKPADVHVGLWGGNTAARLIPESAFNPSNNVTLMNALTPIIHDNLTFWMMLVAPTRFPHTSTSSLHPSWKDAIMSIRVSDKWDQFADNSSPARYREHYAKTHRNFEAVRELAPNMGISISEAHIWEENFEHHFWGQDNWDKLKKIKNDVDPDNLLTNYQAVNWDPSDRRYACYPKI